MSDGDDPRLFEAELTITATAVATHPEGTALDEDGHPIPSEEQDQS